MEVFRLEYVHVTRYTICMIRNITHAYSPQNLSLFSFYCSILDVFFFLIHILCYTYITHTNNKYRDREYCVIRSTHNCFLMYAIFFSSLFRNVSWFYHPLTHYINECYIHISSIRISILF